MFWRGVFAHAEDRRQRECKWTSGRIGGDGAMERMKLLCLSLAFALFMSGCAHGQADTVEDRANMEEMVDAQVPAAAGASGAATSQTKGKKSASSKKKHYRAPEFAGSAFHADAAQGNGDVLLDLSAVSQGYVAVAGWSPARLKFQVISGESTYTYDIYSDGTPSIFPLQCGDGLYTFRVMENVTDSQYAQLYATEAEVALEDPFQPYLRPSAYANYSQDSACVKKAAKLAKKAEDALGVVSAVYDYICKSVKYDYPKAANVQSGYLPNPDETLETGMGICFDYASLAAAMLRSQGIPAKVIFGYVSPDGLYHAWNMFYTEKTGWVTVGYKVQKNDWNRLDLTFAANGADESFIGDGGNYVDVYFY